MRKMMKRAWLRWRIAWLKSTPRKRRQIVGGVAAVFLLAALTGTLYAKYIKSQEKAATVSAREFYFTSDYLRDAEEPMKTYKLNAPISPADTTSVTIALNNFADVLRVSDVDIEYTVTVKAVGEEITVMEQTETISAGAKGTTVPITIDGLAAGTKYVVTVTGEGGKNVELNRLGYLETLQATFEVAAKDATVYMHVDDTDPEDNYVLLTVWTKNVVGDATISIPEGLIPDNTDPAMAGATTGSFTDAAGSFAAAYSSHTYRFFKDSGAGSYTENSFTTVTVGGVNAKPGTP